MKTLISFLIFIYILLLPFGNLFRVKIANTVQVVPQDIVVGLFTILVVGYLLVNKKRVVVNEFLMYQLLFIGVGFVSLLINFIVHKDISLVVSSLYILRYLSYIALLYVGIYFIKQQKLLKSIYLSLILFLCFGFVQYFIFNDLRPLFYLGRDNHLYRLTSTFYDPNFAGILLVVLFWLSVNYVMSFTFKKSIQYIFIAFASVIGVYLTFSRTSLITLAVGIVVLCILKKKLKILLISLIVMILTVFLLSDTHVEGLNPFRLTSSNQRVVAISQSLEIVSKNPLYGVGFNAYRYAQLRYGLREEAGASISNSDAGADNSFIFVLATTGIIGFLLYIMSFVKLIESYLRNSSHMGIAIIVGLFAGSLFTNLLFFTPILGVIFLLIPLGLKKAKVDRLL